MDELGQASVPNSVGCVGWQRCVGPGSWVNLLGSCVLLGDTCVFAGWIFASVFRLHTVGKNFDLTRIRPTDLPFKGLIIWEQAGPVNGLARLPRWNLGPDYMGTGWPGRRAGSLAKMDFKLVLYVKRAATRE